LQEKHLQVQYLNSHPILHYELETYLAIYYNNAHHQGSTHLPMDTVSAPIHLLQHIPTPLQYADVYQTTYKKLQHHYKTHVVPDDPLCLVYWSQDILDNSLRHLLQLHTRLQLVHVSRIFSKYLHLKTYQIQMTNQTAPLLSRTLFHL